MYLSCGLSRGERDEPNRLYSVKQKTNERVPNYGAYPINLLVSFFAYNLLQDLARTLDEPVAASVLESVAKTAGGTRMRLYLGMPCHTPKNSLSLCYRIEDAADDALLLFILILGLNLLWDYGGVISLCIEPKQKADRYPSKPTRSVPPFFPKSTIHSPRRATSA